MVLRDDHHRIPVHELLVLLGSDPGDGLTTDEARARLVEFGPNRLPRLSRRGPLLRFALQFHQPLIYVLLGAVVLTIMLGQIVDASVIFGVVLVNACIGFLQESRAEHALEALVAMVETDTTVIRDGTHRTIPASQLVPGDLVVFQIGDKVPADVRLTAVRALQVDESALTGESVPAAKESIELPLDTVLADRRNMAYSSTLVATGEGRGVVIGTGVDTEIGKIHRLVGRATSVVTPLTRKIARFSKLLTAAVLVLAAVTFAYGVARGEPVDEMITAAVALAVGAIPEGLPPAVTITLAVGVSRMARRRAIVRQLPAVETLGSTTVICTDKTGTLTQNRMTVRTMIARGRRYERSADGFTYDTARVAAIDDPGLERLLICAACCNDARLADDATAERSSGDPTEVALLAAARDAGMPVGEVRARRPRVDVVPFETARRSMATLHDEPSGARIVFLKGAAEGVLALCERAADGTGVPAAFDARGILAVVDDLAGAGLRVLAFARRASVSMDRLDEAGVDAGGFEFLGLVAMADPPRPETRGALETCHRAGISVKMMTGDHPATARAIAVEIGLVDPDRPVIVSGAELPTQDADELVRLTESTDVFARVSPEQKLRLVEALQSQGHIVAMTGDGVNDAPALRQADIGVGMGGSGTDAAKEAADVVLTDDNFATIEAAIEEGRTVFDNLTKFIVWALPTSMGEGLVILVAVAFAATLPILPLQVLWVNMTTAVVLGLTLAFEPAEPGLTRRAPRDPTGPILSRELVARMALVATLMVIGAFGLFEWELDHGATNAEARTVAVAAFVLIELAYLFNCRTLTYSRRRGALLRNPLVPFGVAAMVGLQLLYTYAPFMNSLFGSAPIGLTAWGRALGVAILVALIVSAEKWLRRPRTGGEVDVAIGGAESA
ncbi:MAG TPA: HAD-IC family P-type ATPase [Acidimicrobiia bacterium]|nr:HAD-IC family P-type ATPase [Acidimicrobiia bacterium]